MVDKIAKIERFFSINCLSRLEIGCKSRVRLNRLVNMPGLSAGIVAAPIDQRTEFFQDRPMINAPAVDSAIPKRGRAVPEFLFDG
ncbi:MAG: hypothetical protein ACYCY8_10825, partial [Burkholderiales bacterium]